MNKTKTIYIAGPMTGMPDFNRQAFVDAEIWLEAKGWTVINPVRFETVFGTDPTGDLLDAMCEAERASIPYLDAIYLLRGWEKSVGAKRELAVAVNSGLEVLVEEGGEA